MKKVWPWTLIGRTTLRPRESELLCLGGPLWSSSSQPLPKGKDSAGPGRMCWIDVSSLWPSPLILHIPGTWHPRIPCPNTLQQHLGPTQALPKIPPGLVGVYPRGECWGGEVVIVWTFDLSCPKTWDHPLTVGEKNKGWKLEQMVSRPGSLLECLSLVSKMWIWLCDLGTLGGEGRAKVRDKHILSLEQVSFCQQGVNLPLYLFLIVYRKIWSWKINESVQESDFFCLSKLPS